MGSGFSVFVNIGGTVSPSLGATIRAVYSSFLGLSSRLKNIGASVDKPFWQVEAGLKRHQKRIEKIQEKGVGLTAGITLPTGVMAKRGFDTMLGFEKEMNKAQAYGELDDDSRNQIEAMARRIGRDTQYLVAAAAAVGPLLFVLGSLGKVAIIASRGIVLLSRALVWLATSLTTGLAARIMLLSRSIVALNLAATAGLATCLRGIAAGMIALGAVGGGRAVLAAMAAGLLGLGKAALMFPVVALRPIGVAMWGLVSNPIGAAITAIVVALAALGTWVYNSWSEIKQFFTSFGKGFSKALGPEVTGALSALTGYLSQAWEWMSKLLGPLNGSGAKWKAWGEAAGAAAASMVNTLAELPAKISAAGQAAYAAVTAIDWAGLGTAIIDGIVSGVTARGRTPTRPLARSSPPRGAAFSAASLRRAGTPRDKQMDHQRGG